MIPVLFDKSATDFSTYGIGALSDTISCIVTEERNGAFELEMEYPVTGIHYSDIQNSAIILAKPNESQAPQAFRVYSISNPINDIVTINAEHISYQLNFIPIGPITGTSCADVMSKIKAASLTTNPFNFTTDKNVSTVFTTGAPRSVRALLGGQQGSILQQYQGEYLWDNWDVSLLVHRGADNGVVLRYGKNITDFTRDEDLSNTVTGILPFWKDESHLIVGDISEVDSSDFAFRRIETLDVSSELEATTTEEGTVVYPTKAQVTAEGLKALNNKSYIAVPSVNMKISFVALWQTEEYKDIAPLEHVNLCDTITVVYEQLGVQTQSKVIKTVYDVLLERYNEIEIGDSNTSLVTNIAAVNEAISDSMSRIEKLDDQIVLEVSRATRAEDQLSSSITLNASQIVLKVDNNGKIAMVALGKSASDPSATEFTVKAGNISMTAEQAINFMAGGDINLNSKGITITSDNFSVDRDGNASFSGNISASNVTGSSLSTTATNNPSGSKMYLKISEGRIYAYKNGTSSAVASIFAVNDSSHTGFALNDCDLYKFTQNGGFLNYDPFLTYSLATTKFATLSQVWTTNSRVMASLESSDMQIRFTNTVGGRKYDANETTNACTVKGAQFLIDVHDWSDYHAKKDIHDLTDLYIELYERLKPKSFLYKEDMPLAPKAGQKACGLIAQQVEKACNELGIETDFVHEIDYQIPGYLENTYALDYNSFHALHIQYAHHLKDRIDELEQKNAELEARIAKLEEMIK